MQTQASSAINPAEIHCRVDRGETEAPLASYEVFKTDRNFLLLHIICSDELIAEYINVHLRLTPQPGLELCDSFQSPKALPKTKSLLSLGGAHAQRQESSIMKRKKARQMIPFCRWLPHLSPCMFVGVKVRNACTICYVCAPSSFSRSPDTYRILKPGPSTDGETGRTQT